MTQEFGDKASDAAAQYSLDASTQIARQRHFWPFPYAEVGLINESVDIANQHNPDITHTTQTVLYWGPAGHPLDPGRECEILPGIDRAAARINVDATQGEAVRQAKTLVLGAHIGSAALARVPKRIVNLAKTFSALEGRGVVHAWQTLCARSGAPAAMIQVGRIVISGHVQSFGTEAARLWYPPIIEPEMVLTETQKAIERLG